MYNSIQHFNEFGVKKIEEIIMNFIEQQGKDVGDLVTGLEKPLQELHCSLIAETLEIVNDIYKKDGVRKKKWEIIRSNDHNSFMATCGEIRYNRTYFISKETGKRVYLADKALGIKPHMRMSSDVVIKAIESAVDMSYRASGERATNTEDIISKQAVKKVIHELEIPSVKKPVKEKKKARVLYIDADEDHVSLQFNHKKGDLNVDKNGRKQNTIMPKLIYIYEGIEKEGPKSKRNKLVGKYHFGGVYNKSEDIWQEVVDYIDEQYDTNALEKVYLSGDGAAWIKTGIEMIGSKCHFILDKYHLNKYITQATSHLEDSIADVKQAIYDAFSFESKAEIKDIFNRILAVTTSPAKRKTVQNTRGYILNHWDGIIIINDDADARGGCSAEGHVSHIFSDRLSSRPLGWSRKGVDKMSRLRVYMANGGKVYDLVMYKKEKEEKKIREDIYKQYDQEIRKRRKQYTDTWNNSFLESQQGKMDGLHYALKSLRGICG